MPHDPYPIFGSHAPEAIEFGRQLVNGKRTGRIRYGGPNHCLIFGKSGTGKDTRLLIPNLLRMRGKRSIVCVDPKGEMAACTAHQRAKFGRVVIFNPFGVLNTEFQGYEFMGGCGYNPLAALNPWSPEFNLDAALLAEALVPMSANEKNPFFPLSARALTGGLIMYEVCKAKEQGRVPLLANVRRMICEAAEKAVPPSKLFPHGFPAKGIPAYAQEMANSIILGMRNKGGQFIDWNESTQDVAKTAMSETEFLDDLPMSLNVARNDFNFSEVKERPTTVYLVLPMKVMKRHGKWLRIMLTAALQACMRPRAEDEPSTLFILNEFAAMGHLQLIEDNFTVVRGAGIQMMPILQDMGQMKELYKERWETFIANSDVTATFAPNDLTTAKWFSERCGETIKPKTTVTENWSQTGGTGQNQGTSPTGETNGTNLNNGWSFSRTANHSFEKLPFVTPSDLYRMEPGEMRIVAAGEADTIHAHALPYWEMKQTVAPLAFPNPYAPNARLVRLPQTAAWQSSSFFQGSPPNISGGFAGLAQSPWASGDSGPSSDSASENPVTPATSSGAFNGTDPGWSSPPSPAPKPTPNVASRHPSYPREPDEIGKYACGHPGYTPDPPTKRG